MLQTCRISQRFIIGKLFYLRTNWFIFLKKIIWKLDFFPIKQNLEVTRKCHTKCYFLFPLYFLILVWNGYEFLNYYEIWVYVWAMRYMITENQVHTGTKQINLQVHVMIRNIRPEYHISRYILHVYTERDITYQVLTGRQYERLLFLPSFGTTSALFRFSSCFFLFTSFIRFFFSIFPTR